MRTIHRSHRSDVARSLLELEKLFSKQKPENDNATGERGEVKQINELPAYNSTAIPLPQGGVHE